MTTKPMFRARRWGDNDHYLGPFTFAKQSRSWRRLALYVDSGDEEYRGASLHFDGFGVTVIVALPKWALRPRLIKKFANWDSETVDRLGRDWYHQIDSRRYGFSLSEGHLNLEFGVQTMDSSSEQRWSCFLPWTQWRHVAHRFYGPAGELVATLPDTGKSYAQDPGRWERERAVMDAVPVVGFPFADYDGERIYATTRIEERQWKFGVGWFRWLSLFRPDRIARSLDIKFSGEVGRRKGSWKGGTVGHGITMKPGERHEEAFRRYCAEHDLDLLAPS